MLQWADKAHKVGSVTFTPCSQGGKPFLVTLVDVSIPFEPSAFGGDGSETRKSVCFTLPKEDISTRLLEIEASVGATSSAIKNELVRCKVNNKVCCWDAEGKQIDTPKTWRGWTVAAQLHLRGRWETPQGSGLTLEVTDIKFLEQEKKRTCPF